MFNFSSLIIISLIFLFLQDCVFAIGRQIIFLASITIFISLFLLMLKNPEYFWKQIKSIYKKTPFKYLIWFVIWLFIGAFIHYNHFLKISIKVFLIYCLDVIPAFLFAILIFPKYFSYKKLFRFFIGMYQFIIAYGIVDFLCRIIIGIKAPFYSILCSKNYFAHAFGNAVNTTEKIWQRASSVFFEPSFFATFIFLFIPLVYVLIKSDVRIIKNLKADRFIKLSLLISTWLCLFFVKSPIYIIAVIIYTLIFFAKDIIKFIKKNLAVIVCIPLIFVSLFTIFIHLKPDNFANDSIVLRIEKSLSAIHSLDSLVYAEPSLATRTITIINTFNAAKKVIITGCGYDNHSEIMYKEYTNTNTPLTGEIIGKWLDDGQASPNIFWRMLLNTGIIGVFILYLFFIRSIYLSGRIKQYFDKTELTFLKIVNLIAINYMIISFYWCLSFYPFMWFIFGILCSYIYTYQKRVKSAKQILINNGGKDEKFL